MGTTYSPLSPRLPVEGKRNILVTGALPYVNNVPHLGNIIGSVLSADVYSRFCRQRGYNVLYVCGTDEYGATTEVRAAIEGVNPKEICDKYHELHKGVYEWFGISFDEFGRTSCGTHYEICGHVFEKLLNNELFKENLLDQLYCENCTKFLADSLVEGQCPKCSGSCKGDQCEQCGAFLNARELLNPICTICRSSSPKIRSTEHLFLQLAPVHKELSDLCEKLNFSNQQAESDTRKHVDKGELPPKCMTRDLKWGVPVPVEKFKEKVLYVWFDAPIGYISITKCHTSKWELWWKNPENVELHQFMGKDNVPFHTVFFPTYLIGTGENWTLPHSIHATHFLSFGAEKFSKSKGIGVFGDDVKETNIPVEVWRYYLISVRPEDKDSTFAWEDLQAKLNNELADTLGNFINRVLAFVAKPPGKGYESIIPLDVSFSGPNEIDLELGAKLRDCVQKYVEAMDKAELKKGLKEAMNIAHEGNKHFQRTKVWELYKEDRPRCDFVVRTLVGVVCILACVLEPFMPSFSAEVLRQLNLPTFVFTLDDADIEKADMPWETAPSLHEIGTPKPLFEKLKNEAVEALEKKFSGRQRAGAWHVQGEGWNKASTLKGFQK